MRCLLTPFLALVVSALTGCQPQPLAINPLVQQDTRGFALSETIGPVNLSRSAAEGLVNLREDQSLSPQDVRWLVNNQTINLARFASLDESQPVYFAPSGQITLHPTSEREIRGSWWIEGDQVCYGVEDGHVCSVLKVAKDAQKPFLYFARVDEVGMVTRPTAVVVGRGFGPPR